MRGILSKLLITCFAYLSKMILNNVLVLEKGKLKRADVEFDSIIRRMGKVGKGDDCSNYFLMPGLRNAHVHLASRLVSGVAVGLGKYEYFNEIGFRIHDRRKDEDIYNASLLACIEQLKHGVTHVDTMDMKPEIVIKAIRRAGLGYTACLPLKDFGEEAGYVRDGFKRSLEFNMLGLANEYECTPQLIREGLEFGKEHDLPIHMHACETRMELRHFKHITGMRTIPYLERIGFLDYDVRLAHCTFADSGDILMLAEHDVPVLHCPTSNSLISRNVPDVKLMLDNGIRVRIGTDSFAWNPNPSVLHEAFVSHNVTGISLLQAYLLTHEPLVEGEPATFSLVDLSALMPFNSVNEFLVKLMNTNAVSSVFVEGKEVVKDGNVIGFDEGKLRKRVEKAREKLFKSR